jgi:PhzF family phenazine biosynthesis protein
VDAFASKVLEGNPAAVVPLRTWLGGGLMQKIANENNLAETAFFVDKAPGIYDLRWFTPESEVDLCGHATLASAYIVFNFLDPSLNEIRFLTRSGELTVTRGPNERNVMSLPSNIIVPYRSPANVAEQIGEALDAPPPEELHKGTYLVAVWNDPKTVRGLKGPGNIARILHDLGIWGLIVTAPGDERSDMVSRFVAPAKGVPEDPVTGSAHCALTPFWAARLGKTALKARQASPRGGDLYCTDAGARTLIAGDCALYLAGEITV